VRFLKSNDVAENEERAPTHAVICSNNEQLKVVELESGAVVQESGGHEDIILCLDQHKSRYFLSGSKDNSVRFWHYDPLRLSKKLQCVAVFTGHNESVASVCFAPKKMSFFVSAS
jgi:WD40 repeat protein